MGKLSFSCAGIPADSDIEFITKKSPILAKMYENVWIMDWESNCKIFSKIDNVSLIYGVLNSTTPYDIYPTLLFDSNCTGSGFHVGDTFEIKGISFMIFSDLLAIATQPIGSFAICDDDKFAERDSGEFNYYCGSALEELINDWFAYYVKNETVQRYNIEEIYHIVPMPERPGRFQIVNGDGVVRHNAKGYGFTSEEKARKMLWGYAAKVPIPEEDIKAYEDELEMSKEIEAAYAASVPF